MVDKLFPQDEYYVAFSIKFLTIVGLWNPYDDYRKWLYAIYTGFVTVFVVLTRIHGFMKQCQAINDFVAVTMLLFLILGYICGFIKNINFLSHQSNIKYIAAALNWERSVMCSAEIALYRNKVITRTMKITKGFTLLWSFHTSLNIMCFYGENLDENHQTIDYLSVSFTFLRNVLKPLNFWVILVIDYITFVLCSFTIIANDCLFLGLMFHVETQLKILNYRLRRCTITERDCRIGDAIKDTNCIIFECLRRDSDIRDSTPNQELIICIQHYQTIIRMVRVLKNIYGISLFPQLLGSITMLTFTGIHIFVTKTVNPSDPSTAVSIILALCNVMFQLTAFCWRGDGIISESNSTSLAVYGTHWYQEDLKFRTNLKIFSAMIEHPLSVNAFGLFDLSLITLKHVLTKSYSAMAVLQKANE